MHVLPALLYPPACAPAKRGQPAAWGSPAPASKRPCLHVAQAAPRTAGRPLQDRAGEQELDRWWSTTDDAGLDQPGEYWADADLGAELDDPPEDVEVGENDAQSQAVAVALAAVAQDTKAQGVSVLGVGHVVSWTSYFVVATVTSQPQMNAVLAKITNAARDSFGLAPLRVTDGRSPWEVLDYGEVVVHLMFAFEREHYNLEGKYARAVQVPLPEAASGGAPLDWRKNLQL